MDESILYNKSMEVIRNIETGKHVSEISYKLQMTYSHVHKLMFILEKNEFIRTKKTGRIKKIYLTEKGEQFKKIVCQYLEVLGK